MRKKQTIRHIVSIRKGDQVRVMSGRDRGKTGRVLSVDPFKNSVTVEHASMIKASNSTFLRINGFSRR